MHVLILGQSQSGKSTLAKLIARRLRSQGRTVLAHDPLFDDWHPISQRFTTIEEFSEAAKRTQAAHLFVDECGMAFGEGRDLEHSWLATKARHWGHSCYFIGQRLVQLPPTVRDQCSQVFLFTSSRKDGETLADEWNKDELRECNTLKQFECLHVDRYALNEKLVILKRREIVRVNSRSCDDHRDIDGTGGGAGVVGSMDENKRVKR